MDPIKEAFQKVKQEVDYLLQELEILKNDLNLLKIQYSNNQTNKPTINPTLQHMTALQQTNTSITTNTPTLIPTQNLSFKPLIPQNKAFSIGNEGVPTNQPTNQQTNQHPFISNPESNKSSVNNNISNLEKVKDILSTLDELKKEVRFKFKRLTEQEMQVFVAIYQLEEKGFVVDYPLLAQKLSLSEISIRDYIRKMLKKQIPLDKTKEGNKKIVLSIPQDLKKIASLNTIIQLRQL